MRRQTLDPEFVEFMPEDPIEGVLYVSKRFKLAMHRCCCGCGSEVVTPLSPAEWRLTRLGTRVSLTPSIGNWGFPCQSHYWIKANKIEWARPMTAMQIAWVRECDRTDKARYVGLVNDRKTVVHAPSSPTPRDGPRPLTLLAKLMRWCHR